MSTLLEGVRVIDFTSVLSGPACTQALAQMGAEVIKVEPLAGDVLRMIGPPSIGDYSPHFVHANRNKQSVALDLRDPEAKAACLALIKSADVVVENFRPGVMDKLGFGYEALRESHPELIYASISGFGESGPWRDMRAYDSMIQALSGFMHLQGAGEEPQLVQCAIADKLTGRATFEAILAALFARERGKGGQKISVSMLSAYITFMLQDCMREHTFLDWEGDARGVNAHVKFKTKDGWISFLFIQIEEYHGFFRACGREDLTADPRFAGRDTIRANFEAWKSEMQATIGTWTTAELIEVTRRHQLPVAPVLSVSEMLEFEQVVHNEVFVERDLGPGVGRIRYMNGPWTFSGAGLAPIVDPPHLGESTVSALAHVGVPTDQAQALVQRGAAKQA
ncbi:MAG: CoA transferase [Phenylobacterium sp.]|nr:CoA transferase [Phenylobacterium sp.]